MIPLKVTLDGWMRYAEKQTVDFSGGSLISICGENGAGKSAIFDAITFALYGKHRLGQQSTEELISQGRDAASVDLEFELAGETWRVHRGKSRGGKSRTGRSQPGAATYSLLRWDPVSACWNLVPGTDSAAGLEKALAGILRLTEPAFTSSFLLQQGEATRFLDAKPAERFKIVSSLIDLDAYERLATAARRAADQERTRITEIESQLKPLAAVDEQAVALQRDRAEVARAAATAAATAEANARRCAEDAQRFALLSAEVAELEESIGAADSLLACREQVEGDARTHERLAAILPSLGELQQQLEAATRLEAEAETARRRAAELDIETLIGAAAEAGRALAAARAELQAIESSLSEAASREREARELLFLAEKVREARERLQGRLDEQERLQKEVAALASAKEEVETLTAERVQREDAYREASRAAAAAARDLQGLRDQLKQRREAAGEAVCSRCGQPVTPEHARREVEELTARMEKAAAEQKRLAAAEQAAKLAARQAATALEQAQPRYQALLSLQGKTETAARELADARQALAGLELEAGERLPLLDGAEAAYDEAKGRLQQAAHARDAAQEGRDAAEERSRAADDALQQARKLREELEYQALVFGERAEGCRKLASALADGLPQPWQARALQDPAGALAGVRDALEGLRDAPERLRELREAEQNRARWLGQREEKLRSLEAIPLEHRIAADQAAHLLSEAERYAAEAARFAEEQSNELAALSERLARKTDLEQRREDAALRHQRFTRLAKLLGKTGLQGALVVEAQNTITSHANSFLQRLTGGSLMLSLQKGGGADELDLQAIDTTCMREPRSVQALSGSQKFRCAVAIAFGIGQYAGAGGMRSIVIDEGFGSLDEVGQRQMVEELKALAQHMDKVIVVSHLDIFRDREHFPFQLHIEKAGDTSIVRRAG